MTNHIFMHGFHNPVDSSTGVQGWKPFEINYSLDTNDKDIEGYGQPVTVELFLQMIENYLDFVAHAPESALRDFLLRSAYVTFGKETLLILLLQKGCFGIRFYWGLNNESVNNIHPTLLACGSYIDQNGDEQILRYQTILNRYDPRQRRTDMNVDTSNDTMIFEVVPNGHFLNSIPDIKSSDLI